MLGPRWNELCAEDDLCDDTKGALGAIEDWENVEGFAFVANDILDVGVAGGIPGASDAVDD